MEAYSIDKTFDQLQFLEKGEFENCIFNTCNLVDKNLSDYRFIDCVFNNCNLSMVQLHKTVFRDVQFNGCKMLGLHLENCNEFGLSFLFDNCILNHSSFYKTKIKNTVFKNTQLQETDFAEADLTGVVFDNCNLLQANFDHTILEKADLRTAYNYSIHPQTNRIKKAKFCVDGIAGLLDSFDIIIVK